MHACMHADVLAARMSLARSRARWPADGLVQFEEWASHGRRGGGRGLVQGMEGHGRAWQGIGMGIAAAYPRMAGGHDAVKPCQYDAACLCLLWHGSA